MKKYFEVLRKCPLFHNIEDEELMHILTCLGAHARHFDKKYTIVEEGNIAKQIGIMLSGSAQITRVDYCGNRSILGEITESDLFCEDFACAEVGAIPVSVVANEKSDVLLVNSDHILHTCEKNCAFHQQMIFNLMKDLATKSVMFHKKIEITSKRSTREKLMAYLAIEAKRAGSNSFDIPFDRQELADYLEVDRSGLSAEISKLRKEGIIESEKTHFVLL